MISFLRKKLSSETIKSIEAKVVAASDDGDDETAWREIQPLLPAQRRQKEAAICLLRLVDGRKLSHDRAIGLLDQVNVVYADDEEILGLLGEALEGARDIDDLNAPPPDHPLFQSVVDRLAGVAEESRGLDSEESVLRGLATAARMMGRQRDEVVERSCKRLVELDADRSDFHYTLGLYYKTRGKYSEGVIANRNAANLVDEPSESVEWNLGICATGAGEGSIALDVWKRMEQKIEMGRFGLPEGRYPDSKVRLAERPLAERSANEDDPGLEETIWIERLSPCHGIIRSVLYQDLGVDFGDVILIDGAPITYHKYADTQIPVFPHLATLVRNNYTFYNFAGTQDEAGQIDSGSEDLESDSIIYSHTENFKVLCSSCWRDPNLDHEHHPQVEKHVVTGRIAAPRAIKPSALLDQLDRAFATRKPCRIYVPELCEAAGSSERAIFEKRRYDMINEN